MRSFGWTLGGGLAVVAFLGVVPAEALAQQPAPPVTPDKARPTAPPTGTAGAATNAPTDVTDMLATAPGGITAEQVASRAMTTSYQARAAEKNVAVATARADQIWTNYLPRIGLTARYTRLSEFTAPVFGQPGIQSVITQAAPGTVNPTPTLAVSSATRFPLVFDQYLTQATIAVPISDYFLKIGKSYTAATQQEDAARFDVQGARAKSYADGKVAYFTWLRARGAVNVAEQSLAVARAHQKDAENQFAVGNASKADVLRAQTQVAAAELAVERAKSGVVLTERQIRIAMHAKEDEKIAPGESLDAPLTPVAKDVKALVAEGHAQRPELKSIERSAEAARKLADVQNANKYPSLSAFGDVTYANPNPRRFPQTNEWFPTWAAGAQITWSPNDYFLGGAGSAEYEARAAALEAQKLAVRDGIELEVVQAYQAALEAETAMQTTTRQLESALEGYRVARELFNNGRGTGTTLIDAEIVLAQTRFEHLNARVDARIARVRLEHATGRDVKGTP
jgi:outer membrane protein TolC